MLFHEFSSSILIMLIVWLTRQAHGYHIDDSCQKEGIYDKVEDAMQSAFAMAQAGVDTLRTGNDMLADHRISINSDVNPARPPELEWLIANVFAHQDIIDGKVRSSLKTPREWNYDMTLKNLKLHRVYLVLNTILLHTRQKTDTPLDDDFNVYCDDSRLTISDDKKVVSDAKMNNANSGDLNDDQYKCAVGDSIDLAVTWGAPKHHQTGVKGIFDYWKAFKLRHIFGAVYGVFGYVLKPFKGGPKFRQVDALKLLDVTLLHEMTHTRSGLERDDVKGNKGTFTKKAYGWSKIKALAKLAPYVDTNKKNGPDMNADSIAYFGLGCLLVTDQPQAYEITEGGRLKKIARVTFP
ncbi:hypothetical protein BDV96DRAFT_647168 [Lophiotrema nucula]|uniref:Lysine-specific metallo-endopeptidase domain-containing protein n=1 Tax=Lophiotrema nucula TaxID=690887 RepID=A0A6A5Z609_9PLEO|nr:hypothetical protein BDV96DRAFT_647168 [Lophiotrema nucula]